MATYLDIVNDTLRRLNEVPLQTTDFSTARGFHAHAKDAVNSSVRKILQQETEWPFNVQAYSQPLAAGTSLYALPADCQHVDKNSVFISKDNALSVNETKLKFIDYDEYLTLYRINDVNATSDGWTVPSRFFLDKQSNIGVSAYPDKAYTMTYLYWKSYTELSAYDDVCVVPDMFKQVVVDGAMYFAYMFRENLEAAKIIEKDFINGIKHMRTILINKYAYVMDTRVTR